MSTDHMIKQKAPPLPHALLQGRAGWGPVLQLELHSEMRWARPGKGQWPGAPTRRPATQTCGGSQGLRVRCPNETRPPAHLMGLNPGGLCGLPAPHVVKDQSPKMLQGLRSPRPTGRGWEWLW